MTEKEVSKDGPFKEGHPGQSGDPKGINGKGEATLASKVTFALIIACVFSSMFLVSLDKLIVSTAIPQITDEFGSQDDIGWYGSAYLLTNGAFQLVFGKMYKFLPVKPLFLGSLLIFEVGSALCGAAPSSVALILGRAIAGLGAGGVLTGNMMILVHTVPTPKRPTYQGWFGAIFGIASILGPTVGGAFTTNVTWRWCFYINLPIGGVVMALILILLRIQSKPGEKLTLQEKFWQLNPLGTFFVVSGTILLCLVLQWGGIKYAWSDGRVIALLIISLLLLIAFAVVQAWLPDQAILPPNVVVQRSIAAGFWVSICIATDRLAQVYYIPIWFQAIKDKSAVQSGVDLLPMLLITAVVSICNGKLITLTGYYTPFLIVGACITAIGAGLITTFQVNTSEGEWIGYLILYGFGQGLTSQIPSMAAYTTLSKENISIGTSLMFFGQTLSSAIFVSIGQNILDQQLLRRSSRMPGMGSALIGSTGATTNLNNIPPAYRTAALEAYDRSLHAVFQVALCMACLAVLGAVTMQWKSVKKTSPGKDPTKEKGETSTKSHGTANNRGPAEGFAKDSEDNYDRKYKILSEKDTGTLSSMVDTGTTSTTSR